MVSVFKNAQSSFCWWSNAIDVKAYIRYFSFFFFKWVPLNNYERCFSFHLKSLFRFQDIQNFVFLSSALISMSVIALEDNQKETIKFMVSSII